VTLGEFMKLIEAELGRPMKAMAGGPWLMRCLGLFNPLLRETVEMMYEWTSPYVMDTSRFQRAFGIQPTPLKQAVHETIAWIQSEG
jgi:nucleoside-diphosphate-sugar epimerase